MRQPKGYYTRIDGNKLIARLYETDIVEIEGKRVTLRNGGWETMHTKKCINLTLSQRDIKVFQKNYLWFVEYNNEFNTKQTIPFQDGMTFEVA